MKKQLAASLGLWLLACIQAHAISMTFTNHSDFMAALSADGVIPNVEDYESYTPQTFTGTRGAITYDYEYDDGSGNFLTGGDLQIVDDSSVAVSDPQYLGAADFAGWFEGGFDRVTMSFGPSKFFGVHLAFSNAANVNDNDIVVGFGGESIALDATAGETAGDEIHYFLGIYDNIDFFDTAVVDSSQAASAGYLWAIDNVHATAIPEPPLHWAMLTALCGILVLRARPGFRRNHGI